MEARPAVPLTEEQACLVADHLHVARIAAARVPARAFDDAYQDACLGLMDAARTWDGNGRFGGWAIQRCRGAMLDGYRRRSGWNRRRKEARPTPMSLEQHGGHDWIGDERSALEDDVIGHELTRMIIDAASDDDRGRLMLEVIAAGGNQKEAADAMGVTEGAVTLRLQKLRRRLTRERFA